jgi:hypothetical protein
MRELTKLSSTLFGFVSSNVFGQKAKTIFLLLSFLTIKSTYGFGVFNVAISPSNPTTQDSIKITFAVGITDYGYKFSDVLNLQSDSIFYKGCYLCICFQQTDTEIDDTVRLNPLSEGLYHVQIIARFAGSHTDSFCVGSNPAGNVIVDTFFIVSPLNAIGKVDRNPFYASLLSFNHLRINTENEAELTVSVSDVSGKEINTLHSFAHRGDNSIEWNLPAMPAGMYFYQLLLGDKQKVLRFVKE